MEKLSAEYDKKVKMLERLLRQSEIQIQILKNENTQLSIAVDKSMKHNVQEAKVCITL